MAKRTAKELTVSPRRLRQNGSSLSVRAPRQPRQSPPGSPAPEVGRLPRETGIQRNSEERCRQLSEQLHLITDMMAARVCHCSRDLRYLWVSRSYAQWLGMAPEQFIDRPIEEVLGGATFAQLLPRFQAVLAGRKVHYEEEIEFLRLGKRWVRATYQPTLDAAGNPDGWIAIVMDIDDQKRAEQTVAHYAAQQAAVAALGELALREDDVRALMQEAVVTIARALGTEYCKVLELVAGGQEFKLVAGVGWKPGCVGRAMVGTEAQSQAGYTLLAKEPILVDDLRTETRFSGPQLLHEHGVVSGMSCVIAGPAKQPYGVLGVHTRQRRHFTPADLHFLESCANLMGSAIQRQHFQDGLRRSEEFVRSILNTAVDAIITFDRQRRIQQANPATEKLFQYSAKKLLGRDVQDLLPELRLPVHVARAPRPIGKSVKGESQTANGKYPGRSLGGLTTETTGRRRNGSTFPVDLAVSEIEHLGLYTAIIRDITRRKELERDILQIASLEQQQIGQNLHDECGQELTALGIMVDSLSTGAGSPAPGDSEILQKVQRGVQRVLRHVRSLAQGLTPTEVGAADLPKALIRLVARLCELTSVDCTADVDPEIRLADSVQATHLFHIAQEACTNALRHSHAHSVRVRLHCDGKTVVLQVQDDGVGIQKDPKPGLGLCIMRSRASVIGAKLILQPVLPHGTALTCTLALPRRSHHETPQEASAHR